MYSVSSKNVIAASIPVHLEGLIDGICVSSESALSNSKCAYCTQHLTLIG